MSASQAAPAITDPVIRSLVQRLSRFWWVELILGILWVVVSLVVLKFTRASVTTAGILIGILFIVAAGEEFVLAVVDRRWWWLWGFFAVLLLAGGIVSLIHPRNTFAGFADILGFVFLVIGVTWVTQAFAERPVSDLWWLTLVSGILLIVLAFWTSGQFFLTKAATLLVFTGIWALMRGVIDIVRAFQIKSASDAMGP